MNHAQQWSGNQPNLPRHLSGPGRREPAARGECHMTKGRCGGLPTQCVQSMEPNIGACLNLWLAMRIYVIAGFIYPGPVAWQDHLGRLLH